MATQITTYEKLRKQMEKIVEIVIGRVSDTLLIELKKKIYDDVYNSHGQNKRYPDFSDSRSEFYNAFKWDEIKKGLKELTRNLYYDWRSMAVTPEWYKHTSYLESWSQDTREALPYYLNVTGKDSKLFISVERRSFWQDYEDNVLNNISGLFEKEFSSFGIKKS